MGTNRSGKNRYARIRRAKKNMESRERAQEKPAKKRVAAKESPSWRRKVAQRSGEEHWQSQWHTGSSIDEEMSARHGENNGGPAPRRACPTLRLTYAIWRRLVRPAAFLRSIFRGPFG